LRHLWSKTIDSHYGRLEAIEWAENNEADDIFGLARRIASSIALEKSESGSETPSANRVEWLRFPSRKHPS
jgi:hypothetical protein